MVSERTRPVRSPIGRRLNRRPYSPQVVSSSSPTPGELRDDAKQHGARIADYVARRIQSGSMEGATGSELLRALIMSYADDMSAHGASRKELVLWTRALEAAFNSRSSLLETSAGMLCSIDRVSPAPARRIN